MNARRLTYVLSHTENVLAFLKSKYPLYHLSNVFFRDIQFGIQSMLEQQNRRVGYREAEKIARAFIDHLVAKRIMVAIDNQTWVLHYPEFRKPLVKPPAKPAAPAPPAPGTRPLSAASPKPAPSPAGLTVAQPARATTGTHTAGKAESASDGTPAAPPGS